MADVFLSYSKAHRALTKSLASDLEAAGYSVWWDTSLIPGDDFAEVILQQLDAARAVVVLWTPSSVKSRWVRSEARRADAAGKLIPVRSAGLSDNDIPPPYDALHTAWVEDRDAIIAALWKLGIAPSDRAQIQQHDQVSLSPEQIAEAKELAHWEFIKASSDPKDFLAFLERFPNGAVSHLADAKLAQLETAAWAEAKVAETPERILAFLTEYPGSKFQNEAEAWLAALGQRTEQRSRNQDLAASEERLVPSAAEFASAASRATVVAANVIKALLVAVVVLWVLDVPRRVFGLALYTEQLLTVCLGLSLALAYVTEQARPSRFDWGGGAASIAILAYMVYRYSRQGDLPPALLIVFGLCLAWTLIGSRAALARWFDWAAAATSLLLCGYIAGRYETLTHEMALMPLEGIVGSAVLILLVLEASRRISGLGFVAIIVAMAIYIFISPHFPGEFQTRPVAPERLLVYLGLDINGIISTILQVAVLVVIPFTILGQVLARTGGADFFADVAMSAMGRFRGGAGKIAVVGSGLFGMISGSAVSNVLAVGIVTIPTMIRSGFTPYRAAAIESVGSTGGQLMPPVMGASAFIMAEFLQVSYGTVCIAAAIPALLYYSCLFFHVDLEAAKQKIGAAAIDDAPRISEVLKSGWHFLIPIGFLVAALIYPEVFRLTPEKVAIVATLMLMLLTLVFGYRGRRTSIRDMVKAIIDTGRVSLDIILIGAAAGLMVGIMSISGLAFGMTLQLVALSGDNIFLLLLLIAVLAFLLGIGLPTVSVYILTATLLAPALIKLGVTPMAAHMFVMYNGILSMITPPVAFAAYAAANIARTDGWTTGWVACLVGWSTFILPFLFVLTPSLLMDGSATAIVLNFARVLFGIYLGTAAVVGFTVDRLSPQGRAAYVVLSLAVVLPPEAFSGAMWVNAAGIAVAIALLGADYARRRAALPQRERA